MGVLLSPATVVGYTGVFFLKNKSSSYSMEKSLLEKPLDAPVVSKVSAFYGATSFSTKVNPPDNPI
jgi:hypothetical protein